MPSLSEGHLVCFNEGWVFLKRKVIILDKQGHDTKKMFFRLTFVCKWPLMEFLNTVDG